MSAVDVTERNLLLCAMPGAAAAGYPAADAVPIAPTSMVLSSKPIALAAAACE